MALEELLTPLRLSTRGRIHFRGGGGGFKQRVVRKMGKKRRGCAGNVRKGVMMVVLFLVFWKSFEYFKFFTFS